MTKIASMSKSPYEIRLELLKMAFDFLNTAYSRQMEVFYEATRVATDSQWKSVEQLQALMPKHFSPQDIIDKANELYGFVAPRKDQQ